MSPTVDVAILVEIDQVYESFLTDRTDKTGRMPRVSGADTRSEHCYITTHYRSVTLSNVREKSFTNWRQEKQGWF